MRRNTPQHDQLEQREAEKYTVPDRRSLSVFESHRKLPARVSSRGCRPTARYVGRNDADNADAGGRTCPDRHGGIPSGQGRVVGRHAYEMGFAALTVVAVADRSEGEVRPERLAAMRLIVTDSGLIMHHRNDKPAVANPDCWAGFGGAVEDGGRTSSPMKTRYPVGLGSGHLDGRRPRELKQVRAG